MILTRFLLLLCLSLAQFSTLQSSVPGDSKFRGVVVDADSVRIAEVKVLVDCANHRWSLETDDKGEFKLDLPAGKYQFTLEKLHFKGLILGDFGIEAGTKVSFEFHMEFGECSDCDWIISDPTLLPG